MTNAPERIWIEDEFGEGDDDQWTYGTWDVRNYAGYDVEYVRADIVQALTAERDAADALIEAQAKDHASNNIRFAEAEHRAEAAEAERDRLRAKLADAAVALDAAGMELSDFANCLSREPWAACLAYEAAIDARAALKGETP